MSSGELGHGAERTGELRGRAGLHGERPQARLRARVALCGSVASRVIPRSAPEPVAPRSAPRRASAGIRDGTIHTLWKRWRRPDSAA